VNERNLRTFFVLRSSDVAQALLTTEMLQDVPFLVLGNKIDLPLAASEPVLRDALGLHDTTGKEVTERVDGQRPIEVFMCSVVRKMGYKDGTHKYPFSLSPSPPLMLVVLASPPPRRR
jgi:GTPase SAR1 family protein